MKAFNCTYTDKETAVLAAFWAAGSEINGARSVAAMESDNMACAHAEEISQKTGLSRRAVGGVIGHLARKGSVSYWRKESGDELRPGKPARKIWALNDLRSGFDFHHAAD